MDGPPKIMKTKSIQRKEEDDDVCDVDTKDSNHILKNHQFILAMALNLSCPSLEINE
jgi:hypothetical protein